MRFKKIKYVLFTLICMCVTPLITHAECDYQRQAELARLASNVQLTYTYNSDSGFQVIMTNLTSDLYAVNNYGQTIMVVRKRLLIILVEPLVLIFMQQIVLALLVNC